jgi:hypothetical protein
MPIHPLTEGEVLQKLSFAGRRLRDMRTLNFGQFAEAPAEEKCQLGEEFFFHLIGAVELTAQFVNVACNLGLAADCVTMSEVIKRLTQAPELKATLSALHASPWRDPMPSDPYSPAGLVYRAYNYRHQVTHRQTNPYVFRVGGLPEVSFELDPRESEVTPSALSLWDEMDAMFSIVSSGCSRAMSLARRGSSAQSP